MEEDTSEVKRLLGCIDVKVDLMQVSRIGRISKNRNRLLRVVFKNENSRNIVLQKAKYLRQNHNTKAIFISPDRTPYEQAEFAKLRKELQERREAGEDVVIFRNKIVKKEERQERKNFQ